MRLIIFSSFLVSFSLFFQNVYGKCHQKSSKWSAQNQPCNPGSNEKELPKDQWSQCGTAPSPANEYTCCGVYACDVYPPNQIVWNSDHSYAEKK